MGGKVEEMGLWHGATGDDRDMGSTSRAARQRLYDRRWRPAGMDTCLARRSKTGIRVGNWVQRAVQISLRVVHGMGGRYKEGEGGGSRKHLNGGTGF